MTERHDHHDHHHAPHHAPHGHDHHQAPGGQDWSAIADHIELDGEVMAPIMHTAIAAVVAAAGDRTVGRVVDAGAGPGVATCALAAAFPAAMVHAVDAGEGLLERVRQRAARLGVGDRVTTAVGDLEHGLAVDGPVDVVWASMVLHHVAGPERALRDAHAALVPGGLLALVEFGPRAPSLPAELGVGRPGFADRHHEAMLAALADHLPPGALVIDWPTLLAGAGFDLVHTEVVWTRQAPPLGPDARRWVVGGLRRSAPMLAERLDEDDRATLAALVDPDGDHDIARRDDLRIDHARTLFVARRR